MVNEKPEQGVSMKKIRQLFKKLSSILGHLPAARSLNIDAEYS